MTDLVPAPTGALAGTTARTFARNDLRASALLERFTAGLAGIMRKAGYEELAAAGRDTMVLSVPPHVEARRASVDTIEHWMIYREHPNVGAVLHVHGWIAGTTSTDVNYPCETVQLAASVADLVRRAPDPSRAVVGLRNHGLTITGHSPTENFERVGHQIVPRVPME